jgi:hypothetical protein
MRRAICTLENLSLQALFYCTGDTRIVGYFLTEEKTGEIF